MPENSPIESPLKNLTTADRAEGIALPVLSAPQDTEAGVGSQPQASARGRLERLIPWSGAMAITVLAIVPRFTLIGDQSYWYDEVVTVSVANASGMTSFFATLKNLDATRAPLHPAVLSVWMQLFGQSEAATRALSATCGLITIILIFGIAGRLGGRRAGWLAATFASLSPLMIQYDRETRMYSLLTMLSALAWWNFLRFRDSSTAGKCLVQLVVLVLLAYVHPLGLLMIAALAMATFLDLGRSKLSAAQRLAIHGFALMLILPWIGNYLDHKPEFLSHAVGLKHLIGMPIGFTGGNSLSLIVYALLVMTGLIGPRVPGLVTKKINRVSWPLAFWLFIPPTLLFLYSQFSHPIFGPSRYNVFVAPAWIILIGCGLSGLRLIPSLGIGVALLLLTSLPATIQLLHDRTKADWKLAAEWLDAHAVDLPVIVISPTDGRNFEYVVARYYLGNSRDVRPSGGGSQSFARNSRAIRRYYSISLRDGHVVGQLDARFEKEGAQVRFHDFRDTLRLIEVNESLFDAELIKQYGEATDR